MKGFLQNCQHRQQVQTGEVLSRGHPVCPCGQHLDEPITGPPGVCELVKEAEWLKVRAEAQSHEAHGWGSEVIPGKGKEVSR